ncbi:hypothetical protein ACHAP7_006812 [Fusarium lateritium]
MVATDDQISFFKKNGYLIVRDLLGLYVFVQGKEKINYKLAGSGGFAPHIDAVAYTHIKGVKHLTILLSVDPSNIRNGGLEVVDGSHEIDVPINKATNCIASTWVDSQTWTPVELEAGELLIFTAYLAHRSGANTTSSDRKAIYATYNRDCEGDLRHGTTSTESRSGQLHICVDVWLWISYA